MLQNINSVSRSLATYGSGSAIGIGVGSAKKKMVLQHDGGGGENKIALFGKMEEGRWMPRG